MRHEVFIKTSDGRKSIIIDSDFCQALRVPIGDNMDSVSLFITSWIALLADSPLEPDNKPYKLYKRFLNQITQYGIKAIVVKYTDLAHKLVSQHTLMGSGSSIGDWIDDFKDTPVFFEYNRYFKTGDVKLIDYLYTFLNFGKKLEFVDESFNSAAFRSWLDIENRLASQEYDPNDITAIHSILSLVLPRFDIEDLRPKFGPGSVQERNVRGRLGKLRSFQFDPILDLFLFSIPTWKYGTEKDHGLSVDRVIPDPTTWTPARGVSSRIARLMFVPKNLKTARSICMEPNTLMFFQQGMMSEILRLIDRSPLSNFIDIRDQSRNKYLSSVGSYSSEIDTIDLSAASDSVSFELVKYIFPMSWLPPMIATRSHSCILPSGEIHRLKKFAPMGSALCFPTQCIIFASVCIYAACLYTYEVEDADMQFLDWLPRNVNRVLSYFRSRPGYYKRYFQPLAIYGDDICVDRRLTPIVRSILSRLGFVVNDDKSFTSSQAFRESCGGFYLNGNDITPLYFRVKGVKRHLSASHVASQVHLINECSKRKYFTLKRFLIHSLSTWESHKNLKNKFSVRNPIPFVSDPDSFGILVQTPSNTHLMTREHPDYQRTEYRCWTISYDYIEQPGDLLSSVDSYEYMRWWASRRDGKAIEVNSSIRRSDTGGSRLKWRWIPLQ